MSPRSKDPKPPVVRANRKVTVGVCGACGTRACWEGRLYCEDYRRATVRWVEVPEGEPFPP